MGAVVLLKGSFLDMFKAQAGHKYVKRELVSVNPKRYRYWYKDPQGRMVTGEPPEEGAGAPAQASAEGGGASSAEVKEIHDEWRDYFGFGDIPATNPQGRLDRLKEVVGNETYNKFQGAVDAWTGRMGSDPFREGEEGLAPQANVRLFSLAMGNGEVEEDLAKMDDFYGEAPESQRNAYKQTAERMVTPGTEEHNMFQAFLGSQIVWADYVRETTGKDTLTLSRGIVFGDGDDGKAVQQDFLADAQANGVQMTSASSFSTEPGVAEEFSERDLGTPGGVYQIEVPLEHCLVGHHTHSVGEAHEAEVIVGSMKEAKGTMKFNDGTSHDF